MGWTSAVGPNRGPLGHEVPATPAPTKKKTAATAARVAFLRRGRPIGLAQVVMTGLLVWLELSPEGPSAVAQGGKSPA
jgi:hypothetical protein